MYGGISGSDLIMVKALTQGVLSGEKDMCLFLWCIPEPLPALPQVVNFGVYLVPLLPELVWEKLCLILPGWLYAGLYLGFQSGNVRGSHAGVMGPGIRHF